MSMNRAFWWGKLSGILAGAMMAGSGMPLSIFVEALRNGRLLTESDWFWQMVIYGFMGLFTGAFFGAILGTVLGVLIAWAHLDEFAVTIWFFTCTVAGLLISLVPHEVYSLLSPIIWVWVGGAAGWYCGQFFLNGVRRDHKKTAVSTQTELA